VCRGIGRLWFRPDARLCRHSHLRSGELVEVLPELAPTPWALSVYRPQRSPVPARVRVVYDWLVGDFSNAAFFPVTP
jgi:DNA-binding transcriptional LysR family regulator